jgi:hypothetical protein
LAVISFGSVLIAIAALVLSVRQMRRQNLPAGRARYLAVIGEQSDDEGDGSLPLVER